MDDTHEGIAEIHAGDDRILAGDLADGEVPDPDLSTTEIGTNTEAAEADLLEQGEVAVDDALLEDEESSEGLDQEIE